MKIFSVLLTHQKILIHITLWSNWYAIRIPRTLPMAILNLGYYFVYNGHSMSSWWWRQLATSLRL